MGAVAVARLRKAWLIALAATMGLMLVFSTATRADAAAATDTWSVSPAAPDTAAWRSVAWSPSAGIFVAIGPAGVMTSADGIAWAAQTVPAASWNSVTWSPELGMFAAVGSAGTLVITSPDGVAWTSRTVTGSTRPWGSIVWSSARLQFLATAVAGGSMTSSDGLTWTVAADLARPSLTHGLAWSPSLALYVAVTNNGAYTSPDGLTWTLGSSLPAGGWRGVTWSPTLNLFVAAGISGTSHIMSSPDGLTWTATPTAVTATLSGVTWSPDQAEFVAVGLGSVLSSTDGISWATVTDPAVSNTWSSIVWSPSLTRYVAVSSDGASRTMTGIVPAPSSPPTTGGTPSPALAPTGANGKALPIGLGLLLVGGFAIAFSPLLRRPTGRHRS